MLRVCHGRRGEDVVAQFVGPALRADALSWVQAVELTDFDGIVALPGARAVLDALPLGWWAGVTSGGRALMTARLAAAQLPVPETLVCAEDVSAGKPNPEGYLKAAAALGFAVTQCVVVEDAPAGVGAGRAAGARVLAVTTTHNADQVAGADVIVADLSSLCVRSTDTVSTPRYQRRCHWRWPALVSPRRKP